MQLEQLKILNLETEKRKQEKEMILEGGMSISWIELCMNAILKALCKICMEDKNNNYIQEQDLLKCK